MDTVLTGIPFTMFLVFCLLTEGRLHLREKKNVMQNCNRDQHSKGSSLNFRLKQFVEHVLQF